MPRATKSGAAAAPARRKKLTALDLRPPTRGTAVERTFYTWDSPHARPGPAHSGVRREELLRGLPVPRPAAHLLHRLRLDRPGERPEGRRPCDPSGRRGPRHGGRAEGRAGRRHVQATARRFSQAPRPKEQQVLGAKRLLGEKIPAADLGQQAGIGGHEGRRPEGAGQGRRPAEPPHCDQGSRPNSRELFGPLDGAGLVRSSALRMVLLTAARPGEVCAMRFEHRQDALALVWLICLDPGAHVDRDEVLRQRPTEN